MYRFPLFSALVIVICSTCAAEEVALPKSVVKVYPVGNLVGLAITSEPVSGMPTQEPPVPFREQTIQALEEIQIIVDSMCSHQPTAVSTYSPSLSLVVRHSTAGHQEIDQLLKTLGGDEDATIRMVCRGFAFDDVYRTLDEKLTEEQEVKFNQLYHIRQIRQDETAELMEIIPAGLVFSEIVTLKPGRHVGWGLEGRMLTAIGCVNSADESVSLRFDYVTGDDNEKPMYRGIRNFTLHEDEAGVFHHHFDGGVITWIVTASILQEDKAAATTAEVSK